MTGGYRSEEPDVTGDDLEDRILGAIVETSDELKAMYVRHLTEKEVDHFDDIFICYEVTIDQYFDYLDAAMPPDVDLSIPQIYELIDIITG